MNHFWKESSSHISQSYETRLRESLCLPKWVGIGTYLFAGLWFGMQMSERTSQEEEKWEMFICFVI